MLSTRLREINLRNYENLVMCAQDQERGSLGNAVRDVMRIHQPDTYGQCESCQSPSPDVWVAWPCDTVEAISDAVGFQFETL